MKNFRNLLFFICIGLCLSSCSLFKPKPKVVYANNRLYTVETIADNAGKTKDKLVVNKLDEKATLNFEDKTTFLQFKAFDKTLKIKEIKRYDITEGSIDFDAFKVGMPVPDAGKSAVSKPFFAEPELAKFKVEDDGTQLNELYNRGFLYGENKPVIQAINITLKFRQRPSLSFPASYTATQQAAVDSFPRQVESGVNLGLALGYKFTYNWFRSTKDALGRFTNQLAFAPAIFIGTGVTDISNSNTRFIPKITTRKTAIFSFGGVVMFGFNNINVGYATGWDWAQGDYGKDWVFQGKQWQGIILALDILK